MEVVAAGWKLAYAPDAWATEAASASDHDEVERRARIGAGGLQATLRLAGLANPRRHGRIAWMFVSHRAARWVIAPPLLVLSPLLTLAALSQGAGPAWWLCASLQLGYGALALRGSRPRAPRVATIAWHFLLAHVAVLAGLGRYLRGRQSVIWAKAER
jgi:hypothetical protein